MFPVFWCRSVFPRIIILIWVSFGHFYSCSFFYGICVLNPLDVVPTSLEVYPFKSVPTPPNLKQVPYRIPSLLILPTSSVLFLVLCHFVFRWTTMCCLTRTGLYFTVNVLIKFVFNLFGTQCIQDSFPVRDSENSRKYYSVIGKSVRVQKSITTRCWTSKKEVILL